MKKLFLIPLMTLFIGFSSIACAQQWYPANQNSVGWDAVTQMMDSDGNLIPIPEGDQILYDVYTVFYDQPKENAIFQLRTAETEATVTHKSEGKIFVGIETIRIPEGEVDEYKSYRIAWSDNPDDCKDGNTFGFKYYYLPYTSGGMVVR